jgi:chromate transport protein ChrA
VSLFLAGLPLWVAAILLVVLPTMAAMCGPVLMRRRIGLERLASNNEIAGFKFATVGVIYAVLLAFAEIVVWEKFSDAETAVVQEAGASATLYPWGG